MTKRAQNCLTALNLLSTRDLVEAHPNKISNCRNAGAGVIREWIRRCYLSGRRPEWLREVLPTINPQAEAPKDFKCLAGPYHPKHERWMVELAIANLGSIEWCVVECLRQIDGVTQPAWELWRSGTGFKDGGDE